MKKLSNIDESFWGDVHRRSRGDEIRKEDDITNIRDIKPVDMGVSVLWADKDLEYRDGSPYFAYDEADELIKNSGWRLPTQEEAKELFKYTIMIKNTAEACILEGDFDDKPQLVLNKKGYKYGNSDEIYQETFYNAWTSSKTYPESYYMFTVQYSKPGYVLMHYKNKCCVRLIKDK